MSLEIKHRVLPEQASKVRADLTLLANATSAAGQLLPGSSGPEIEALQRSLKGLNLYSGRVTGTWDAATTAAVQKLEAQTEGATADGIFTSAELSEIRSRQMFVEDDFKTQARAGQKGSDVAELEKKLKNLGYHPGTLDGVYDGKLEKAVKAYRLDAKGVPNKPTGAGPLVIKGLRGEVHTLEAQLEHLGRKVGKVDGTYTRKTAAAVRAFQRQHDLKPTGIANERTRNAIERAYEQSLVRKPHVISRPNPNFNSRGCDIDAVILHHTAGSTAKGCIDTLRARGLSVHYVVGKDGKIYQLVNDKFEAFHAGEAAIRGDASPTVNARSIGIEIVNLGTGHDKFTNAQYKALEQLVPFLMKKYKVPMKNLLGHKDVALPAGRKTDPANNFDWDRIRDAVRRVI